MTTKAVLTTDSTITCGHATPGAGGKLDLAPQQDVLTIGGKSVLIDSLQGVSILPGCSQVKSQDGEVLCSTVASQSGQVSTVLKVNGKPVLLQQTSGKSNGKPLDDWSSTDAKQAVLTAD